MYALEERQPQRLLILNTKSYKHHQQFSTILEHFNMNKNQNTIKKPHKSKKPQKRIAQILSTFGHNIESLRIYAADLKPIAERKDKDVMTRMHQVTTAICRIMHINPKSPPQKKPVHVKMTKQQAAQIAQLAQTLPRFSHPQQHLLYKSSFVMLVSHFDYLLADLMRCHFQLFPDALPAKLEVSVVELKKWADISDGIEQLLNKEVESVTYRNFDDQLKYLSDKLNIRVPDKVVDWDIIKEGILRRNIIVHNDGKANKRYLSHRLGLVLPKECGSFAEHQRLVVSPEYFTTVLHEVLVAGIILSQCAWRQWHADDADTADKALIAILYDLLKQERWVAAEKIGLASRQMGIKNNNQRLYININYLQALKWQGKTQQLKSEIAKIDLSALSPIFVLAFAALQSDSKKFYSYIPRVIASGDQLTRADFMEWPLFKELRADPKFKTRIDQALSRA
jgi:hypothetical protein